MEEILTPETVFILERALVTNNVQQFKIIYISKGKGKSISLQAWGCPEGSRKLRFPDYMTTV